MRMNDARRNDDSRSGDSTVRNWQSVRTVLEGLILIGVVWLASGVQEQMKATVKLQVQLESMSNDVSGLRTQLADIPTLSRSLARIEVELQEHERRISQMEQFGRTR